jgi:hypothetical protein
MADIKIYNGSTWNNTAVRKYETKSEIITPPTTIYADGTAISIYTIKGNTVQSGTPSPSNPVDVNGVGNMSANLINYQLLFSNNPVKETDIFRYYRLSVTPNTQYTLKSNAPSTTTPSAQTTFLFGNSDSMTTANNGVYSDVAKTVTSTAEGYIFVAIRKYYQYITQPTETDFANGTYTIMINEGTTALPYEPYGYKIPITNGQQTTNIYLGSTQTTRQIKKLVLDGNEESWLRSTSYSGGFFSSWFNFGGINYGAIHCSHAQYVSDITDYVSGTCYSDGSLNIRIMPEGSTVQQWREYLAQQYAAGTPVTVWYVLATPETGTVNEPLQKIGTYADTLSNATAIPTTDGANTITVDTTVQPSEFSATWTGWHDSSVQEYTGGVGTNKFNTDTFIRNSERSGQTGEVIPNAANYGTSELIFVESGKTLYFSQNGTASAPTYLYTYQADGTFIQRLSGSNTYTIPSNCGYVAICIHISKLSKYQIQYDEVTAFEPYEYGWV